MDPNAIDPRKALEIQNAYDMGGLSAVYGLGVSDTYVVATEHLRRIQRLTEAKAAAALLLIEEHTDALIALHQIKAWVAKNLPEIDIDLWEILLSIDTSAVEGVE